MRTFHASLRTIAALSLITLVAGVGVIPAARAGTTVGIGLDAPLSTTTDGKAATADNYTAYPLLNVGAVPPLVMLVMSRDEQLYIKAYTDYTDLNGDGVVDTTYQDGFDYSGYFDANLCYGYGSGVFKAAAKATDDNGNGKAHECDGSSWSGNFLNWAAMSRIDVLRLVLYGGNRSTDGKDTTVLERSYIPSDLHAWAKVYLGSDVKKYTPFSTTDTGGKGLSLCNVSPSTDSTPKLRVAKGSYTEWASTAREQCRWREDVTESGGDINPSDSASRDNDGLGNKTYTVRVQVCDAESSYRESFCRKYTETAASGTATDHWKPAGLLQRYGENGSMRFGLVTGTYSKPRAGGVLRRNIGLFAGNGTGGTCAYNPGQGRVDEVNLQTGQFCNTGSGDEGIVNTLSRFRITSWDPSKDNYSDCSTYGILQRKVDGANGHLKDPATDGYDCKDSGNPLAEMYAEALRYIGGESAATTTFNVSDTNINAVSGLPLASWLDPYRDPKDADGKETGGNPYCANCSIIVITTGLNSFDSDQIPDVASLPVQADAATTLVGTNENLAGADTSGSPPKYLVGRYGALTSTTYQDVCTPYEIDDLALAHGICPDVPSLEGGYQMAGLAYEAWTNDIRPDKTGTQKVQTYAIALAESLPSFTIPVCETGNDIDSCPVDYITITPACQANNNGSAALGSASGWRSCYLGNLTVGPKTSATQTSNGKPKVYGVPTKVITVNGQRRPVRGSFAITWEDSQWGNDHDNDVVEMLSFCVGAYCSYDGNGNGRDDICEDVGSNNVCSNKGTVKVNGQFLIARVQALSAYAGNALRIGYTMAGADNSTGQAAKFTVLRPGGKDGSLLFGSTGGADKWDAPTADKLSTGPSEQLPLPNPLFFSAKYGGFADQDDNKKPDRQDSPEWDAIINDSGVTGQDGLPDNYFMVRNPAQLQDRLSRTFDAILKRAGSGTAAAVVANSAKGVGLVYQALYQAERKDSSDRAADWSGTLNGLWTDSFGRLRENGNGFTSGAAVLDGYDVDPVIEFYYDPNDNQTKFHREIMPANADGSSVTVFDKTEASITDHGLDELKTVWSAQDQLWATGFDTGVSSDLTSTNRNYTTNSSNGRYIFTWIDKDHDGVVDNGEEQPFVFSGDSAGSGFYGAKSGTTYSGNFRYLNTADPDVAKRIVAWIRGYEITDKSSKGVPLWRSRTVDYNNDGTLRVLRLGDIVDSTPVVVGTPSEAFDLLYGDTSYGTFRDHYRSRRQVVYVGANDGMLHAFNGGFYNAREQKLQLAPTDGTTVTQDPLGGELWAYVPGNLLPHLRWLADPDYKHNFYVDGSPIAQDVKIFGEGDTDHPDGWGTILIVPFRFGGGPISVNTATDGTSATQNSFSAYVVLDVTNPEKKPVLLAELTNTELSDGTAVCDSDTQLHAPSCVNITKVVDTYTSSIPAAAIFRDNTSGSPNKFFLFTGSGTTDNGGSGSSEGGDAVATTQLKIRAFDMEDLAKASGSTTPAKTFDLSNVGETGAGLSSFAGDLIASDYNLDGRSEGLYFGSVKNNGASGFGGSLWKLNFTDDKGMPDPDPDAWTPQQMLSDLDLPITIRPTVGRNDRGAPMVFVGTGRAYTRKDLESTAQQKIVGLIDTSLLSTSDQQYKIMPLEMDDLLDVTDIDVYTDNSVTGAGTDADGSDIDTFNKLLGSFDSETRLGWFLKLTAPTASGDATPAERVVSTQSLLGGVLLTSTFFPGTDTCTDVGRGALYGLNYKSGTANPALQFFGTTGGGDAKVVNRSTDLGPGLPAPPSLHVGEGTGERTLTACVQTSTGAIICKEITTLKSVLSSEVSWHEPLDK
ncbi:pilus assembly protein [Frateuria sp. STR12]|uniref:pilus assembly protein n=1 Tax=Frateuria hangzhouensis TaxID=2995589 RepID=UPI002260EAD6|nr:PilC/PilY family type IV pilus protein [Frateuria sp. STR12]MCX7514768.1 PilC/PilY family type IV pilus protein [Frateuria sp. STR12]